MAHRRYSPALVQAVLEEARRSSRPLAEILAQHGIPARTYHHWRVRFKNVEVGGLALVQALRLQVRKLQREKARLLKDIAIQRELLGKPWRRLQPGGPPSDTRSGQPE